MNEYLRENKRSILLLITVFLLLAIVLFFAVLRPLLADFSSKEEAIVEQKDRVELLKARIKHIEQAEIDIEQLELENKIPLERKLDEYILSLQQLETMTESKIDRIEFVYDSNLDEIEDEEEIVEKEPAEELTDNADETEESEEPESETDRTDEKPSIDPEIIREKPEDLQVMTVRITATSPNFDKFIELLETIENKERISIVSKLHFHHPTEEDILAEDSVESISFEAELTTFYYEQ